MLELIPCLLGALVSLMFANRIRQVGRIIVAAAAGVIVAVASGEAAAWPQAVLLDAILAAGSCIAIDVLRARFLIPSADVNATVSSVPDA